jgi:vancomycin permeability regulator SanA
MLNNVVTSFSIFTEIVYEVGRIFLVLMTPPMFILALAVSISNIWLMKNEGYRPVNALGIAVSILWGIGLILSLNPILHFAYIPVIDDHRVISEVMTFVLCYFECMILSTSLSALLASHHTPPYDRDCMIILGCGIRKDGTLTPLLRGRVDSALNFLKKQKEISEKEAIIIPSGGQGSDEIISESEAMTRYLLAQDVPEDHIFKEDRSTNTFENMKFSKEVIENAVGDIGDKKIAFATTNYHIFRGYILAKKNGFEAQGVSAKTKWYFFPNAFLREFIGLLYDKMVFHFIFLVFIVSLVGAMTS